MRFEERKPLGRSRPSTVRVDDSKPFGRKSEASEGVGESLTWAATSTDVSPASTLRKPAPPPAATTVFGKPSGTGDVSVSDLLSNRFQHEWLANQQQAA